MLRMYRRNLVLLPNSAGIRVSAPVRPGRDIRDENSSGGGERSFGLLLPPSAVPAESAVHREGSGAAQGERCQARKIEEIEFISWGTKLSPGHSERLKLDREETVREMYGKYRHKQDRRHWQDGQGHQGAHENGQSAHQLDEDRRPTYKLRCCNTDRVQDVDKVLRPVHDLGIAMCKKAIADDQAQRDRRILPEFRLYPGLRVHRPVQLNAKIKTHGVASHLAADSRTRLANLEQRFPSITACLIFIVGELNRHES